LGIFLHEVMRSIIRSKFSYGTYMYCVFITSITSEYL